MTVRISVNYNDLRWKRFNLANSAKLLISRVVQIHQISANYCSLSVLACNDVKIKELNKVYRKKNKVTNVLAWPAKGFFYRLDKDNRYCKKNKYLFLGDIAISYEKCLTEASLQNVPFNKYCCKLLVHAMLHLLGYDHDLSARTSKMQLMETRILNSVLTNRPKFNNI